MTDEEIIKAFKHCITHNTSCKPCPYCFIENGERRCNSKQRNKDILDMIKRLKSENANLTVENEVLKRDVQNLERTLEEGREELEGLKAGKNILLIELEDAQRKISEYEEGRGVILTADEYVRLKQIEVNGVIDSFKLREIVRKEMAKELLQRLYSCKSAVIFDCDSVITAAEEEYGVEVEE